jgi:threonine synthase
MTTATPRPGTWQVCAACGEEVAETDPRPRCGRCGGLLEIRHRLPGREQVLARVTDRRGHAVSPSGVWRFKAVVLPTATDIVSHPEGNTPLLHRSSVDRWTGAEGVLLKHEGHNPTGSFKDRGMTVGVTQARRIGARAVACASTGNTSASLAAWRSGSWRNRSPTGRGHCWCGVTSTRVFGWWRMRARSLASTC